MTKKGSTAKIAAIIVAVMLCVALLSTVLVACSGNTITFETNGGTAVDSVKKTVDQSPKTTRAGFKFDGWYTEKEFKNKVKFPYTAKGDVTLYAKWNEETDADRIKEFYNLLGSALENSIGFDGSKQFGIDVNLGAMGVGLNIKANVDPKNLSKVAANIEIVNGDTSVMNIFADDEFLYLVNDTMKKRLKDFNLEAMLSGVDFNNFSTTSYGSLVGTMLGLVLVPENSTYNKDGNTYTVEGSLAGIIEILGDNVPAEIGDLLAGMNLRIKATIEDNSIKALAITVVTQLGEVAITSDQLKLGNGLEPAITLPDPTDKDFDETYGLNFNVKGQFNLITKNADYTTSSINYDYTILIDYNIFGALRNAFGGEAKGATAFFGEATQDSKIFIDIYHKCGKDCGNCANRLGTSEGSVLSIAYSPADFNGSNDIKIAANAKHIIPKGLIDVVAGMSGAEGMVSSLLADYIGANIDPAALLASIFDVNNNTAPATVAETAGFDLGSLLNPNVLQIVANAFDLAKSINLSPEGLKIGITALTDLLDTVASGDMNFALMAQLLLGKADILNVSAVAEFADPSVAKTDMFLKFMTIDENMAKTKSFASGNNNYTPALTSEFVKETDGRVKITKAGVENKITEISTHNTDGTTALLSPEEARILFETGATVEYKYNAFGSTETKTERAKVQKVIGLDYKLFDVPQYVTVITSPTDGKTFSNLLNLLQMLGLGEIDLPAAMFETTITLTKADVKFTSSFDAGKKYGYGDAIDASLKAVATYSKGGETVGTKEIKFEDTNALTKAGKFNTFLDQSYTYSAFGKDYTVTAQSKGDLKKPEAIKKTVKIGEKFELTWLDDTYGMAGGSTSIDSVFTYGNKQTITKSITTKTEPIVDSSIKVNKINLMDPTTYATTYGFGFNFTKSGVYTVVFDFEPGTGLTQEYVFTVPETPNGKYTATSKFIANDMIEVILGRGNMVQQSLVANTKLTLNGTELTDKDFKLQAKVADKYVDLDTFTILYNQIIPQVVYIKITNTELIPLMYTADAKITFTAKDFSDYEILTTETTPFVENNYELVARDNKPVAPWGVLDTPGKYININKFAFKQEIPEAAYALKFETSTDGKKWTPQTIGTGNDAKIRLALIGYNSASELLIKDYTFAPINGSGVIEGANKGDLYIYINDVNLITSNFQYRLTAYATSHDDYVVATATGSKVGYNSYITTSDAKFNTLKPSTGLDTGKYVKIDANNLSLLGLDPTQATVKIEVRYAISTTEQIYSEWVETTEFSYISFGYKDDKSIVQRADTTLIGYAEPFDLTVADATVKANQYLRFNLTAKDFVGKSFEYRITVTVAGKTIPVFGAWCHAKEVIAEA